jgi:long-subunit acyl-CoA synthetase (AMP-forming)
MAKRNFKTYQLIDANGNIIITGRKKTVMGLAYGRYVYEHIFDDVLMIID